MTFIGANLSAVGVPGAILGLPSAQLAIGSHRADPGLQGARGADDTIVSDAAVASRKTKRRNSADESETGTPGDLTEFGGRTGEPPRDDPGGLGKGDPNGSTVEKRDSTLGDKKGDPSGGAPEDDDRDDPDDDDKGDPGGSSPERPAK